MSLNPAPATWVTSAHSNNEGGNCVEWSPTYARTHGIVPVRDSKMPHGPTLGFSPASWATLVAYAHTSSGA
ncbi:DUF397 domain-containing protein [Streptomyces sp. NPDC093085]|uniref:DUF397 domain-containing protein n=1 Tax=Streptomyces sp. NPDC093085 TaxID=3155068 RepID=UPI003436D9D0